MATITRAGSGEIAPSGKSEYAIEVLDLVKEFRVYHRTYGTLKGRVTGLFKEGFKRGVNKTFGYEVRRILDGVTFRVPKGACVALVGRNGAGKSTLLSILSRIYMPTAGEVRLHGRMMSLLELGAGFHPELTGGDNLLFSAAMMGVPESEMRLRFDDILDFSGLDPGVIDLPMRMYSSGMQMRLGFSNAVHMDAEILLVDEGLAVGDEGFQEKSFRKIEEFRDQGKTILMVTHELDHIERLADRVLWLQSGKIVADGLVDDVLARYRATFHENS